MRRKRRRSRKGTGTIYRPKGHFEWYWRTRAGSKDLTINTHTEDREEAERVRGRYLAEMATGLPGDAGKVTMADLAKLIVNDYRTNNYSSIKDMVRRFDHHILPFFGPTTKAIEITAGHIEAFKTHRKAQKASAGEINRELENLGRAFSLAIQQNLIGKKPHIERIPVAWGRTSYITEAEFAELLKHWPSIWTGPLIEFMNWTGWRLSEVQPLQWKKNVDWQAEHLILREGETKSGKPRIFPFGFIPELKALLKQQLRLTKKLEKAGKREIPWVFHRNGKEIRNFWKDWKAARDAAGIGNKKRHDFRSTAARRLLHLGFQPQEVCFMVGWEDVNMLYYYSIADIEVINEKAKIIGRRIKKQNKGTRKRVS